MAAGWNQQIVTWTGNGVAGRLIPTSIDLTQGICVVWIWPVSSLNNCMRHSGMNGTSCSGVTTIVPIATGGITSLTATGFTVKDNGAFPSVNQAAIQYTAIVLQDLTGGLLMQVGSYHGQGALGPVSVGVTFGSHIVVGSIGGPWNNGRFVDIGGTNYSVIYIDASHFQIEPAWFGSTGTATMSAVQPNQAVNSMLTLGNRQTWVFGRGQVFWSDDFTPPNAVNFPINATTLTTLVPLGGFVVGVNDNVNNDALIYYWVTFSMPAAVQTVFKTWKATGTGASLDVALPFTPGFAVARPFDPGAAPENVWRGPLQVGLDSNYIEFGSVSTQGIRAFGLNKLTLGTLTAPLGMEVYGFALVGGFNSVTITVVNDDLDIGGPSDAVVAALEVQEGRGLVINVARTARWFLERFDIRRRREEHKG